MEAIMGIVIVIVVAVIIVAAAVAFFAMNARRRGLRQRFGPEYERLASEHESRRKAEAELAGRERRVAELNIRPLRPDARARYRAEWAVIQERFVEAPADALTAAARLVTAVLRDRGYPAENYGQVLADLSVGHSQALSGFRHAHEVSMRADAHGASTEDMRRAMINYRTLFQELAGADEDEAARHGADDPGATGYEGEAPLAGPHDTLVAGGGMRGGTRAPAVTAVGDPDLGPQGKRSHRSARRGGDES
jgi:hypothetical protein